MAMINIRKTSDTFERYKMPRLIAKIEGRGNGIKTVIVNMVDISKALKRPPLYPTKFFGCELGAQIQVDTKNERYIVNGAHTAERLQELLYGFIEKYVLCSGCGNPETKLQINAKKQNITATCSACGHTGPVEAVSRFSAYLIKHPPDQTESPAVTKKETKKDKEVKSAGKTKSGKTEQNGNGHGNGSAGFGSQESEHVEDDDDDWLEDTEEEALRRREEQQLSEHVRNLILTDENEKSEDERLNIFYSYCKNLHANGQIINQSKLVFDRADALGVKDKAPLLLMDLLVSLKTFQKDLEDNKHLFSLFTYKNVRAQRNLLGGVEKLVASLSENEIKQRIPPLLQLLYLADLVEEHGFFDWGKKASSRYVGTEATKRIHAAAEPFMVWLKEAEEEESEEESPEPEIEDEAESDLHVDFTHNAARVGVVEVIQPAAGQPGGAATAPKKDTMEDLDIDGI